MHKQTDRHYENNGHLAVNQKQQTTKWHSRKFVSYCRRNICGPPSWSAVWQSEYKGKV